jgi:hypothetical protein
MRSTMRFAVYGRRACVTLRVAPRRRESHRTTRILRPQRQPENDNDDDDDDDDDDNDDDGFDSIQQKQY